MRDRDDYHTYLKIIPWEAFFSICNKRANDSKCIISGLGCITIDKETMLNCPLWKKYRNFYGSKAWAKIKQEEDQSGGCNKEKRKLIAKELREDGRRRDPIKGRFHTEDF